MQCTQTEVVYVFGSFNCDDFASHLTKTHQFNTASIRRVMEVISLWHCWGGMEAQVSLTVAFSSSAFFALLFLIFLLTIPHRFSVRFRSGEFAGQSSTPTHGHLTNFWCFWQYGQVPNPAGFLGKRVQWCWFSKNTMDQHQQMTLHTKSSQTVET